VHASAAAPTCPDDERLVVPFSGDDGYAVVTPSVVAYVGGGDAIAQAVLVQLMMRSPQLPDLLSDMAALLGGPTTRPYPAVAAIVDDGGTGGAGLRLLIHGDPGVHGVGVDEEDRRNVDRDITRVRPHIYCWSPVGRPVQVAIGTAAAIAVGAEGMAERAAQDLAPLADLRHGVVRSCGLIATWTTQETGPGRRLDDSTCGAMRNVDVYGAQPDEGGSGCDSPDVTAAKDRTLSFPPVLAGDGRVGLDPQRPWRASHTAE
jgi:hypothetical protein